MMHHILYLTVGLYLASTFAFFGLLLSQNERAGATGRMLLAAAAFGNLMYLVADAAANHRFPLVDAHEALACATLVLAAAYFAFFRQARLMMAGVIVAPLASFLVIIAVYLGPRPPAVDAGAAWFLPLHIGSAVIGYGLFAMAFVAGIVYLLENFRIKKKKFTRFERFFPSLATLDAVNYHCIVYGFPFLTLSMIAGSMRIHATKGAFLTGDPGEIWTAVVWLVYAALLHARFISGWKGRRVAVFSVVAFLLLIAGFVASAAIYQGYHSYKP